MNVEELPDEIITSEIKIINYEQACMTGIEKSNIQLAYLRAFRSVPFYSTNYNIQAIGYKNTKIIEKIDYSKNFTDNIQNMLPKNDNNKFKTFYSNEKDATLKMTFDFKADFSLNQILEYFEKFQSFSSRDGAEARDNINKDNSNDPRYYKNFMKNNIS